MSTLRNLRLIVERRRPQAVFSAEHSTHRCADVFGAEQRCRHLIKQRLESVVVVPVDQSDLGGHVVQLLGHSSPPNPAPTIATCGVLLISFFLASNQVMHLFVNPRPVLDEPKKAHTESS
jgi:hypothetical protein